jgi:hypothetical protein
VRWLCALIALGGCQTIFGLDHVGLPSGDGGLDAKVYLDAPPAGIVCAGQMGAPLHECAPEAMLQGLTYSINIDIDTDMDGMCSRVEPAQNGQHELCLVLASDFTLAGNAKLTAHGSRPLVVVAMGRMTIAGTVDVSSHVGVLGAAANDASCITVAGQGQGFNAAGGGPGGSFGSRGGAGGLDGNGVTLASPPVDPTTLAVVRGGCPGGAGGYDPEAQAAAGGDAGGAVYLMAGTSLTITGSVLANGRGGSVVKPMLMSSYPGGAGGGTGGLIMLDAPATTVTGVVMANGGGGGAGGSDGASAGNPGADPGPAMPTVAAAGGTSTGDGTGGSGGAGSTLQLPTQGGFGMSSLGRDGGGGGGGGGQGVIRIFGSFNGGGTIVPAAT